MRETTQEVRAYLRDKLAEAERMSEESRKDTTGIEPYRVIGMVLAVLQIAESDLNYIERIQAA